MLLFTRNSWTLPGRFSSFLFLFKRLKDSCSRSLSTVPRATTISSGTSSWAIACARKEVVANPLFPEAFTGSTILAVGAALRYSFFAFSGWEGATYIAEEIKNPRRNLPLSLFIGIGGVMVLYLGANAAYLFQLPPAKIAESPWVATEVMTVALGASGGILISVAVMLNTFGNVSTQILCKARSWQAMARDGMFFDWFAKLHPKHKTPNNALLGQAQGQVAVGAQPLIEDLDVAGAVHRLDRVLAILGGQHEHVVAELVRVARFLPQGEIHQLRGADLEVAALAQLAEQAVALLEHLTIL